MDFLHLFRAGGFMMYPLILCSLVVVAIFIERFRYYRSNRSHVDQLGGRFRNIWKNGIMRD